jgi:hypothetical protein
MKKILFILVALVYGHALLAQDIITLRSGEEIKAKVQEIGTDNVKYKKYDNLSGPIYTLMKSEIFMIKYENGDKDIFKETESPVEPNAAVKPQASVLRREEGRTIINVDEAKRLTTEEAKVIFAAVPAALEDYESGIRYDNAATVCVGIGGCAMSVGLIILMLEDSDINAENDEQIAAPLLIGGGLGVGLVGLLFYGVAVMQWDSAVTLYNGAKNKTHVQSTSLNFGLTRSGGIGFTLNF